MGMSFVVEYLKAQVDKKIGNVLVSEGVSQIVGVVPALTSINFRVVPAEGEYAQIYFRTIFDPNMVPNVFFGLEQYAGSRLYEGFITRGFIDNPFDYFIFASLNSPILITIRNLSNLNQYYASESTYLSINTEDAYYRVLECLARLQTSRELQAYFKTLNLKQGNNVAQGGA